MMAKESCIAVVLAAGKGSRMNSDIPKQYMLLDGKPLICHCLEVFEKSACIDGILLVTGSGERCRVEEELKTGYNFSKLRAVIEGGAERYHSVYNALCYLTEHIPMCSYVFIHDGARPFLEQELISRLYETVQTEQACLAAVRVKDTIKVADAEGAVVHTPARNTLWAAQTPQVFFFPLIRDAYERMLQEGCTEDITDDAQVVERMIGTAVKIVEGSYRNKKITTPEDLPVASHVAGQ